MTKIFLHTETPDRRVGYVQGEVFFKVIRGSKHILRRPPSIATDKAILEKAQLLGAVDMEVTDTETSTAYTAPIDDILRYGFLIERGHSVQVALPLTFWTATTSQ